MEEEGDVKDRLMIITDMIERYVLQHPLVEQMDDEELNDELETVMSSLLNAYQRINLKDETQN